jgi:hypothetical protein
MSRSAAFMLDVTSVTFALVLPRFMTFRKINIAILTMEHFVMNVMLNHGLQLQGCADELE